MPPPRMGAEHPGVLWPKDRSVRTDDGASIAYTFLGPEDGRVVALCAGLLCPDTWWQHLAPALTEAGYRVLLFHYRGIGTSSAPAADSPGTYAIERCAGDLAAIVDHEGLDRFTLLGHSMGVQVALEAYRTLADRVEALVALTGTFASPIRSLYDRGPLITYGVYHPARLLLQGLAAPVRARSWRLLWTRAPMLGVGRALKAFGPATDERSIASYLEHVAALDPGVVLRIAAAMHEHEAADVLPRVGVPALIVAGERDPLAPLSQARRMAAAIPSATLHTVPEGTHGTILEHPEVVNALVLDFLSGEAR